MIICAYKAVISRLSRCELGIVSVWQRNYYEHIIRNESEMNAIASYISSNPAHWSLNLDTFHSPNPTWRIL